MASWKRISVVIMCFAMAFYVDAKPRVVPQSIPDIYKGKNIAKDHIAPGEKIFDVRSFGAIPDGKSVCTQAFIAAWRATCQSKEQARLLVPKGRFVVSTISFTGPCLSPNPITIQVVGTVVATTELKYVNGEWLIFENLDGVHLTGGGTFDGMGMQAWKITENCEANPTNICARNPSSIYFHRVRHGSIQHITSVNPKGFHIFVTGCANMKLKRLKLIAPPNSPNTDGIHISYSVDVLIAKNTIETGDDCISLIHGVTNTAIKNLRCGPGHGISVGSLGKYPDEIDVKNVLVKNCTMIGTMNGIRIKTWPEKYAGGASDIRFTDIIMENVRNPIIIDQEYQCEPGNCKKKPSLVKIQNVIFSNIRGTTATPIAVDLRCSKQFPCQGVQLSNIDLHHGPKPSGSRCTNIEPIYGGVQKPLACI